MNILTKNIEFNIFLFGFMVNFIWEMLQMPFYNFSSDATIGELNRACLLATIGDAVILIVMYWISILFLKSRNWFFHLTPYRIAEFLSTGIIFTIIIEYLSTEIFHRWTYGDLMPTLPFFGTGLIPILQWLIVPLVVLWLIKRQLNVP